MNSRIGRKLLISVIMCLALTVAIVNTVTIFRATAHSNSLMLMQARSGLNIIMHRLEEHLNRFEDIYNTLELSGTISQENVFNANATWANAKETESDFAAFYNEEGKVYWQTGNYNLADISLDRRSRLQRLCQRFQSGTYNTAYQARQGKRNSQGRGSCGNEDGQQQLD